MTIKLSSREEAKVVRERLAAERRRAAKLARPKSEKADRGRVRDNGYLAFLRRQPCVVGDPRGSVCEGRIDPAHIRFGDAAAGKINPGLGVKPSDRFAVSLCRYHHEMQHSMNERTFWQGFGVDPIATAARLYAEYRAPVMALLESVHDDTNGRAQEAIETLPSLPSETPNA